MDKIVVGCDPEMAVFIHDERDKQYSGVLPAAFVFERAEIMYPEIVNTRWKENPASRGPDGKLIVDGISLELNPAPGTPKELVKATRGLLTTVDALLKGCSTPTKRLEGVIRPTVELDVNQLEFWGDPMLAIFGCDPDETIYPERDVDPRDIDAITHPWRYFGGHIHLGWPENPEEFYADSQNIYDLIIVCDALLGSIGVIFDQVVEEDARIRRKVYGQPGVFRHQPHGLEYRTVANSWLLTPARMKIIFSLVELLPVILQSRIYNELYKSEYDIRRMLITGDLEMAISFARYVASVNEMAQVQVEMAINLLDQTTNNWRQEWL